MKLNEARDIDALTEDSRQIWKGLFANMPQAWLLSDGLGGILDVNPALEKLLGMSRGALVGLSLAELLGASYDEALQSESWCECGVGGDIRACLRVRRQKLDASCRPLWLWQFEDHSEAKYTDRLLSFLSGPLKSIESCVDLSTAMSSATKLAIENLADWCRIDLLEDGQLRLKAVSHRDPLLQAELYALDCAFPARGDDPFCPLSVVRSGMPEFHALVTEPLGPRRPLQARRFEYLRQIGLSSYICVPIRDGIETVGALSLGLRSAGQRFHPIDLLMAEELAAKAGLSLERTRLYERLARMKETAESANQAKTQFLANVSHEIRTPLGAILGFAELLCEQENSVAERGFLGGKIRDNGSRLLRIIDDILNLSRVEAGKLEVEMTNVELPRLLHAVHETLADRASEKGIDFAIEIDGMVPRHLLSDETRLMQILFNVVGNAIKFTSAGHVHVSVRYETCGTSKRNLLLFDVVDTGLGLSVDQAARLFMPFSQGDTSHTRRFGGTGLGLALSKRLAQALGGDLVLSESEEGQGSRFQISIDPGPISVEEMVYELIPIGVDVEDLAEVEPSLDGVRVLLVEDSSDNQILLRRFLEESGAEVEIAGNGEDGVRKALRSSFDLVLMDIQMPLKDGYEATRELRAEGYQGAIVALTAHAMKEEQEKCLRAGCNAHLSKPMRRRELIREVARYAAEFRAPMRRSCSGTGGRVLH